MIYVLYIQIHNQFQETLECGKCYLTDRYIGPEHVLGISPHMNCFSVEIDSIVLPK